MVQAQFVHAGKLVQRPQRRFELGGPLTNLFLQPHVQRFDFFIGVPQFDGLLFLFQIDMAQFFVPGVAGC